MKKALVLCAGYGTRLGTLTRDTPKPMLPLAGEPLLAHTLRYLAAYGYHDVAINLHYKPEVIPAYFGTGAALGLRLHYVVEPELLGTAGAVRNLAAYFADVADFLVLYGDILIDQDLDALAAYHAQGQAAATLLLHERPGSNSLIQRREDGRITAFIERPTEAQRAANPYPWVNSGVQMLNHRLIAAIPADRPTDLPKDIYMPLVSHEVFLGLPLTGYRCAIDSPQRYAEADAAVRDGRYRVHKQA